MARSLSREASLLSFCASLRTSDGAPHRVTTGSRTWPFAGVSWLLEGAGHTHDALRFRTPQVPVAGIGDRDGLPSKGVMAKVMISRASVSMTEVRRGRSPVVHASSGGRQA